MLGSEAEGFGDLPKDHGCLYILLEECELLKVHATISGFGLSVGVDFH